MSERLEILSFDIKGKFAHFRKFHGNNTALTYSIPPRTTIIGMLGNILGYEKDSYYEKLDSEKLKVGIRILSGIKKTFHRLNYLKIVSKDDFTGQNGRVQTPFEIVSSANIRSGEVHYRVYISPGIEDTSFSEIKDALVNKNCKFSLSLGTANFLASIENVHCYPGIEEKYADKEWVYIHSACNSDQIMDLNFPEHTIYRFNHIEEELMPADFLGNYNRELKAMNRVLFTTTGFPIYGILTGKYYELNPRKDQQEIIQFLEYANLLT